MKRLGLAFMGLLLAVAPLRAAEDGCRDVERAMIGYRAARLERTSEGWAERQATFAALAAAYHATPWQARCEAIAAACAARAGHPEAWRPLAREGHPAVVRFLAARGLERVDRATALATLRELARQPGALQPEALVDLGELAGDPAPLLQVVRRYADHSACERALYLLGASPTVADRSHWLRAYRERYPAGPHRLAVAKHLASVPGLDAATRLAVAAELLEGAEYGPAAQLLKGMTGSLAAFRAGRAAFRLGDYPRAEALLKRAEVDPQLRARALLTLGQLEEKRKRRAQAIACYLGASLGPGDDALEGLDRLAAVYRKADDEARASRIELQIIARYPAREEATECRWRELWRAYRRGDRAEAERWARAMGDACLVKVEGPGGAYWLARLRERDGAVTEAQRLYHEIVIRHPYDYYGWRSRVRLASLETGAPDPGFAIQPVRVHYQDEDLTALVGPCGGDPRRAAYARSLATLPAALRELAYLGEGGPLWREIRHMSVSPDLQAYVGLITGHPAEAIPLADQDETLRYPLPFYPWIQAAAALQGLDPLWLASLVKQESLFDPTSRSWVGAVGLAQLMPGTASWVGRHVPGPVRSLSDPFWNLKLGAYYLAYVSHKFGDQPVMAVASYNAGPQAVRKWVDQAGQEDIDAWVELIPYGETRHYVKKVFANLWNYQRIYGAGS